MNSISKEIIKKRWLICCLLFFHITCNSKKNYPDLTVSINDSIQVERNALAALDSINLYKKIVKTGDLILRTGRDFTSETMKQLSLTDKTYSHCGIASIENDTVFVYHSIGGEWNPNQKLRKDPFEFFCNPYENRGFGIFRYHLTPIEDSIFINVVHIFYKKEIKFDMQFNLATNDRMYCSEFVYKSLSKAINHKIILPTTTFNHIKFVAIDNLFINPLCKQIKRVVFSAPKSAAF
jgi:hypothetical protein